MLAYYLLFKNEGEKLEAFPPGFQMLAGDTLQRNFTLSFPDREKSTWTSHPEETTQKNLALKALGFNCLNYGRQPEASMYRHFMPDKEYLDENCPDGIRAELFFPSCWNGETDSPNHQDHVAYPDLVNGGSCPKGFERRLPSLFYETIWDTNKFKGKKGQFVWSNGDPTGYGYHGDFITGWEEEFLQKAVDECTNQSGNIEDCPIFDIQSEADARKCTFEVPEVLKSDDCEGPAAGLCGNVAVQNGPEYATHPGGNYENPETPDEPTYTPPPTDELPPVPTLSYKPAESAVTDEFGGGISVARHGVAYGAGPSADLDLEAAATPTPSTTLRTTSVEQPATTPAPVAPSEPQGSVISTSTYTSAGVVYEVEIVEVPVYVTVDTPAPAQRRHVHHGHRKQREHGILGRRRMH